MKRILVTGGSGYVGLHTVGPLRDAGYHVYNYDKRDNPSDDVLNIDRLEQRMLRFDVVYHLVAIPHPYKGKEWEYRYWNFDVAKAVFKAAARAGVRKFIFASSGCYYGVWGGHGKPTSFPVKEDTKPPSLAEGQTLYGFFKATFEEYMAGAARSHGMKSVALRIEGLNKAVVTSDSYTGRFLAGSPPEEQSCKLFHFLGNCSPENYLKILTAVIETDLENWFEAFNVDNGTVHPSIDPHALVRTHWPEIPDEIATENGSLISIEKARRLLSYHPDEPAPFREWRTANSR